MGKLFLCNITVKHFDNMQPKHTLDCGSMLPWKLSKVRSYQNLDEGLSKENLKYFKKWC